MSTVDYAIHPAAELFPEMPEDELSALADDIRANGLRDRIVLFDDKILDGRHRYRACRMAGVEPAFTKFAGPNVLGFVISRNLHRRHLTESQRAMVAADLANVAHGGDRKSNQPASLPVDASSPSSVTQADAAKMMGVSERSVRDAVAVRQRSPDLAEQVRAGKLSVSKAAAQVRERATPVNKTEKPRDAARLIERLAEIARILTEEPSLMPAQRVHVRQLAESIIKRLAAAESTDDLVADEEAA